MPDFGDDSAVGCKGKIDFLFVISRQANMTLRQKQLTAAFPQFIDTIHRPNLKWTIRQKRKSRQEHHP